MSDLIRRDLLKVLRCVWEGDPFYEHAKAAADMIEMLETALEVAHRKIASLERPQIVSTDALYPLTRPVDY